MKAFQVNQSIVNPEVIEYIETQSSKGEAQEETVEKLLNIGVAVITRVQSSRDVDFVKKESQRMISSFEQTISKLETDLFTNVDTQINQFFNPDLETSHTKRYGESLKTYLDDFKKEILPIIDNVKKESQLLVKTSNEVSSEKVDGIEKKITMAHENLNPDLEGSYFGKMRRIISMVDDGLANQLDDSRVGTFAYRLKEETDQMFGENSPILDKVSTIIEERTKSFEEELILLRESIAKTEGKEEGMKEALEKSTAKGRIYEADVLDLLHEIAKPFNDVVEYTGDISVDGSPSKKGDFIYRFNNGGQILIEAKDSTNLGHTAAIKYLNKAMEDRAIGFSILVHKDESQLSNQVDCMGFFEDNKIVTSTEYLRFAVQWARIFLSKAEDKMVSGVNETLVLQRISDILSKLKTVKSMKSKLSTMRNNVGSSCDAVSASIDELKNHVTEYLNDIENEFIKNDTDHGDAEEMKLAS